MVLKLAVFDLISGDNSIFEQDVLGELVNRGELMTYKHNGFWQCMDTLLEKKLLEDLWTQGNAPWKKW